MKLLNFKELEAACEKTFEMNGPWWHLYTPGNLNYQILCNDEDFKFAMNLIARCLTQHKNLNTVAFELMSNHLHIVLSGERIKVVQAFEMFRRKLSRYLSFHGREPLSNEFRIELKAIESLSALRNTIVYVNRNGFLVNTNCTPFSYPWGTGRYYFHRFPITDRMSDFGGRELRAMFCSRTPEFTDDTPIIEGYISPTAFCAIELGLSLFRNAHHYFFMVSKNVEAYGELAEELDDGEFLTDSELYGQLQKTLKESYEAKNLYELTKAQKLDIAKNFHNKYRSSNGQISRVLRLAECDVKALFPFG